MIVALTRLASLGPVSGPAVRAIGVFPCMLIRGNSDCCAARVNEVRMLSNFAQGGYLPKGTKLSPGLKERKNFFFQHLPNGYVYRASLHYPMSIRAIDPVCPQAILPMRVTLFHSGTLCVTRIPSRNCDDKLYCLELNGKHDGENCISLKPIVFEI